MAQPRAGGSGRRGDDPGTEAPGRGDHIPELGAVVRELRQRRRMSVASLAAQARLTPGAISQLESGRIQPSLSTVRSLAEALGVPVFRFFLPDAKDRRVVVRKGDRKRIALPRSKATYELLTPDMRGQLELTEVRLPPGESTGDDLAVHPGEESIVIVRGRAELELDGEVHVLRVGDAATYAAELPHRLTNPTRAEVVAISVITPPWF